MVVFSSLAFKIYKNDNDNTHIIYTCGYVAE